MVPANRRGHRVVALEVPLVIRRTVRVSGEVEFQAVACRPCIVFPLRLQQLNSSLYAALHNKHIRFKRSLFASDGSPCLTAGRTLIIRPFVRTEISAPGGLRPFCDRKIETHHGPFM
jgi:hypothetical protein